MLADGAQVLRCGLNGDDLFRDAFQRREERAAACIQYASDPAESQAREYRAVFSATCFEMRIEPTRRAEYVSASRLVPIDCGHRLTMSGDESARGKR